MGTEDTGGYGMLNRHGNPWPSLYSKKLCTQHVRYGDSISFPIGEGGDGRVDVVVACDDHGRSSVLIVHQQEESASYDLGQLVPPSDRFAIESKIDASSGGQIVESTFNGTIHFDVFGVAAITANSDGR